jgi:hypothetical protein
MKSLTFLPVAKGSEAIGFQYPLSPLSDGPSIVASKGMRRPRRVGVFRRSLVERKNHVRSGVAELKVQLFSYRLHSRLDLYRYPQSVLERLYRLTFLAYEPWYQLVVRLDRYLVVRGELYAGGRVEPGYLGPYLAIASFAAET